MQRVLIHGIARTSLALAWLYQGLVPKLLFRQSSGELEALRATALFDTQADAALTALAVVEIVFGASLLMLWRVRSLFLINIAALVLLALVVAVREPVLFVSQFNPATLNLTMLALGLVGWLAAKDHEIPKPRAV